MYTVHVYMYMYAVTANPSTTMLYYLSGQTFSMCVLGVHGIGKGFSKKLIFR